MPPHPHPTLQVVGCKDVFWLYLEKGVHVSEQPGLFVARGPPCPLEA